MLETKENAKSAVGRQQSTSYAVCLHDLAFLQYSPPPIGRVSRQLGYSSKREMSRPSTTMFGARSAGGVGAQAVKDANSGKFVWAIEHIAPGSPKLPEIYFLLLAKLQTTSL